METTAKSVQSFGLFNKALLRSKILKPSEELKRNILSYEMSFEC
jgi:hypothetical protein